MASFNYYNSSFNPYEQNISLIAPDGVDTLVIPLQTVFDLQAMSAHTGIMFGVQIGMVAILLLVLAMVTKPSKCKNSVFVLNVLTLAFILIRNVIECLAVVGPFYNYYNWVASYYVDVTGAQHMSVAAECLSFLIDLSIELSLMFQVKIVCCTLRAVWRRAITLASTLVVLMMVGMRFALMVVNIRDNILIVGQSTDAQWNLVNHLASASNICLMTSIIFFSLIFCTKLAHAIIQRRKMGIKQFGPMQIIFVMGCQTLFIPAIFGFLSYVVLQNQQLNSFMPVIVATFLPLSAMWATTNTGSRDIAAPCQAHGHGFLPVGPSVRCNSGLLNNDKENFSNFGTTVDTLVTMRSDTNGSKQRPTGTQITSNCSRDSIDMELEKLGHQINVKRTVSVHSIQGL